MTDTDWTETIPRQTQLQVPFDFTWLDDGSVRDVSGYQANLVIGGKTPQTILLAQDPGKIGRKLLNTTEATFPAAFAANAHIQLLLNGATVDRLWGRFYVTGQ